MAELRADRVRDLVPDHLKSRRERVPGAHGPRQQLEGVGELLLELVHALARHAVDLDVGEGTDAEQQQSLGGVPEEHPAHDPGSDGEGGREGREGARVHGDTRPIQAQLQGPGARQEGEELFGERALVPLAQDRLLGRVGGLEARRQPLEPCPRAGLAAPVPRPHEGRESLDRQYGGQEDEHVEHGGHGLPSS